MKFAIRALVLGICAAGASAAVLTSHATTMMVSHQGIVAASPVPTCGPKDCTDGNLSPVPTCGPKDCTDGN